ncbi:MAG TPA: PHB depolymerase family esterase [Trueperaceae bacterium]|nr:PHB depolymerase family esterase [Trueperaceae bacterium]
MSRSVLLSVFCLQLVYLLAPSAAAQTSATDKLAHAGLEREYYLHVPAAVEASGSEAVPLVVLLHGRGGTGAGMASLTDFDVVADAHGLIAVYPSGVDNQWNYVDAIPGYQIDVPDIAFLRALVADLSTRYPVDPARVYVAGFSNGGYMAQRLACDAADLFAAFASVGAAGYGGQPSICGEAEPVSILFMHGTNDAVVPFGGLRQEGPNGPITVLASVEQTFSYWADRIGCSTTIDARTVPSIRSPAMEVHVLDAEDCPAQHELELVVVVGGGHNWPGQPDKLPVEVGGAVNLDLDASRFIWEFFERHTLSAPEAP